MSGVAASRVGSENRVVPRQTDALNDRRTTDIASRAGCYPAGRQTIRELEVRFWNRRNSIRLSAEASAASAAVRLRRIA